MTVRRVVGEARDAVGAGVSRLGLGLRLRAAIVGGMTLAVAASAGAGGAPVWILPIVLVGGALVAAARPDSQVALGMLLVFGWYWLAHVERHASAWTIVAAAGLLLFHLAAAAAALGPAEVALPPQLLRTWARRAAPILAGTVVLWLLTRLLTEVEAAPNMFLTAAALAAVAAAGWLALARSRPAP